MSEAIHRLNEQVVVPATTGNGNRLHRDGGPPGGATVQRSTADLIRELSREGVALVRQEVALAKAELNEKIETFRGASMSMAVGGGLLLVALFLFAQAVNHGLTALLAQVMSLEVAVWLAPLILAGLVGAGGWSFIQGGKKRLQEVGLSPEATRQTLEDDKRWARNKVRELKEEIRHG